MSFLLEVDRLQYVEMTHFNVFKNYVDIIIIIIIINLEMCLILLIEMYYICFNLNTQSFIITRSFFYYPFRLLMDFTTRF